MIVLVVGNADMVLVSVDVMPEDDGCIVAKCRFLVEMPPSFLLTCAKEFTKNMQKLLPKFLIKYEIDEERLRATS